jgi:hypothetical protein
MAFAVAVVVSVYTAPRAVPSSDEYAAARAPVKEMALSRAGASRAITPSVLRSERKTRGSP